MKKLLALMMAIAMLASGVAAFAAETDGSFSLLISDPYFTYETPDSPYNNQVLDFTGLGVAFDAKMQDDVYFATIAVLAAGTPAIQALFSGDKDGVTGTIAGMTHAFYMTQEDMAAMQAATATPVKQDPTQAILSLVESFEYVDAGREVAEFYGGGRLEANKQTFSITEAQFDEIMKAISAEVPEGTAISVDATLWIDDSQTHQRFEALYHLTVDGEMMDIPLIGQSYHPSEEAVYAKLHMELPENGAMDADFTMVPNPEFEGYANLFGEIVIHVDAESVKMVLIGWPEAVEEGVKYSAGFTIAPSDIDEEIHLSFNSVSGDAVSRFDLTLSAPGMQMSTNYDGTVDGDNHAGTLNFRYAADDNYEIVTGRLGVQLVANPELSAPDLSGYTLVDISDMEDAALLEQLQIEAQTVLIQAMGALMQVPALQSIIMNTISY